MSNNNNRDSFSSYSSSKKSDLDYDDYDDEGRHSMNDDDDNNPSAMMSLFSSYYGIEEETDSNSPNSLIKKSQADLIDSSSFNPDEYVKDLLITSPFEQLVKQDSSMNHEIRILDSDMQMLVYENYSKFISATETIKRMKINVEAMYDDMESVKLKMESISASSLQLDDSLSDRRSKISKLVRVRRLLHRLEFLSELPDKLAVMIDKEKYHEAVSLYNKTIHVLKQHSHVLSFKNIQAGVEKMMIDLRSKVMNLLDDVSLDTFKLTQHVAVLRLMEAPPLQVVEKFLNAHSYRSQRIIKNFNNSSISSTISSSSSTATTTTSSTMDTSDGCSDVKTNTSSSFGSLRNGCNELENVSLARTFHQSFLAGLIEACKGISGLFAIQSTDSMTSPKNNPNKAILPGNKSSRELEVDNLKRIENGIIANKKLLLTLEGIIPDYIKSFTTILSSFFSKYKIQMEKYIELENQASKLEYNSNDNDDVKLNERFDAAKLSMYDIEEERQAWIMLSRQAILDCQFLENAVLECHNISADENIVISLNYSSMLSEAIFKVLNAYIDNAFVYRLRSIINRVVSSSYHIKRVSDFGSLQSSSSSRQSISSDSAKSNDNNPFNDEEDNKRNETVNKLVKANSHIKENTHFVSDIYDNLIDIILCGFSDICNDNKSIIEIRSICEESDNYDNSIDISDKLIWQYCDAITSKFEEICDVNVEVILRENGDSWLKTSEFNNEIYTERYLSSNNNDKQSLSLILCIALKKLNLLYFKSFKQSLKIHDLQSIKTYSTIESKCELRVSSSIQNILLKFIDSSCSKFSSIITKIVTKTIKKYPLPYISTPIQTTSNGGNKEYQIEITPIESDVITKLYSNLSVNPSTIDLIVSLEALFSSCCIILNEKPHSTKVISTGHDREFSRRSSIARGGISMNSVHGRTGAGLQLDIERLFAQKIKICDNEIIFSTALSNNKTSSNKDINKDGHPVVNLTICDVIMTTIMKSLLKTVQETVRLHTISYEAYIYLQTDLSCLKQCSVSLLKDKSEYDNIIESVLSSIFSRYIYANDINLAGGDSYEVAAITRAASEGLQLASKNAFLLSK